VAAKNPHQAICARVAQFLLERREALGLSMNVIAQRAGLSQQMVSYVERGMRNPTLETLLRMCAALETSLPELIRDAEKRSRR
jgi:transcriptional regulator with XRE-family HTH domain